MPRDSTYHPSPTSHPSAVPHNPEAISHSQPHPLKQHSSANSNHTKEASPNNTKRNTSVHSLLRRSGSSRPIPRTRSRSSSVTASRGASSSSRGDAALSRAAGRGRYATDRGRGGGGGLSNSTGTSTGGRGGGGTRRGRLRELDGIFTNYEGMRGRGLRH